MEPKLLPLVAPLSNRFQSLSVDAKIVNGFAEASQKKGEAFVYKRPGFKIYQALGPGIARGLFSWEGDLYAIVNGTVFKNGVSIGTVQDEGVYSFTSTVATNTPTDQPSKLFFHNTQKAYFYNHTTIAEVVDSPYPDSTTMGAVYLDGTIYVMEPTRADIFNSLAVQNAPDDWDSTWVIKAQIEPQKGVYLAKNLVYVMALKEHYTEAFYDAGNPTGSPLSPVQGAKMNFGCYNPHTVRDVGGDLIWVADSGEGYPCVVMVSNLKLDIISTPPVERLLAKTVQEGNGWASWNCRIAGHRFYGVTFLGATIPPDPPLPPFTLVFDLTSRLWYQWTQADGRELPYLFSAQLGSEMMFLHRSNGNIVCPEETASSDEDDPNGIFTFQVFTPNYDAETRLLKVLNKITLIGDQAVTQVKVAYSDDDYANWSQDFIYTMNEDRPDVIDLGAFTKRAFRFTHKDATACRIESVELYMTPGVMP